MKKQTTRQENAEKFIRSCLAISYGSVDEGIRQIGMIRFNRAVQQVLDALPQEPRRKKAGKFVAERCRH